MSPTTVAITEVIGYLMTALGLGAVIVLCRPRHWPHFHKGWLLSTVGIGVLLDWLIFLRSYHWSPKLIAWGFPFAAAFFEVQEDGHLMDFVGPMTPVHFMLNLFIGLSLPHLFLAGYVLWKKRHSTGTSVEVSP
jgi:hypothetical protein